MQLIDWLVTATNRNHIPQSTDNKFLILLDKGLLSNRQLSVNLKTETNGNNITYVCYGRGA
jgi:hypothetical protein